MTSKGLSGLEEACHQRAGSPFPEDGVKTLFHGIRLHHRIMPPVQVVPATTPASVDSRPVLERTGLSGRPRLAWIGASVVSDFDRLEQQPLNEFP